MIVFLNGSINSGKTTIGKILHQMIPRSAHIEDTEALAGLNTGRLEAVENLFKNYIDGGMSIIVSCPISEEDFNRIKHAIEEQEQGIYAFTLRPRLDVAIKNRGTRLLSAPEVEQIKHDYETGVDAISYGKVLDNSEETPEQTAARILESIN